MQTNTIQIVIGSWGSYNECNERALGSKWLDLSDYSDWEEIQEELTKEGFELNGIDEELFIQDIEGINDKSTNWDFVNPKDLFDILSESNVLVDDYQYQIMQAFLEIRSFDEFRERVQQDGSRWSDNINIYQNYDWSDYGMLMLESYIDQVPEHLRDFIDLEGYGKYCGDYYVDEYSNGLIEIIR